MIAWGGVYGVVFGLALLATRPFLPGLFGVTPDVRLLLLAVLLIVAAQQPVSGVVFVLDGALIGAGDQDYLALAGLVTLAVFGLAAAAEGAEDRSPFGIFLTPVFFGSPKRSGARSGTKV